MNNRMNPKNVKVGDAIRIIYMDGEPHYNGRSGVVTFIDAIGQLHGTWGGLAVCGEYGDIYEKVY